MKLANLLVAWAEVHSLFLNQMTLIYKHQTEPVAELLVGKQRFETLTCQHLWRDDDQPVLPISCFFDQILVLVRRGVANGVLIDRDSRYSLQAGRAFLGRSQ